MRKLWTFRKDDCGNSARRLNHNCTQCSAPATSRSLTCRGHFASWPTWQPRCANKMAERSGPLLHQLFGNLDGVEGGALEELVAGDPAAEAVLQRAVLAEAADGAVVFVRLVKREWILALGGIVDDVQAGRFLQHRQRGFDRRGLLELGTDCHRVRSINRHAHAGDARPER